jgi:RimJ/RimL family protein N-acetyltransferase
MFPVLADGALYQFTGGEPPGSVEDVEVWFSSLETRLSPDGSEQWLTWIVQLIESSVSIGYVQATINESKADLAWLIGVNWQAQGYATEATRVLMRWLTDNHVCQMTAHIHKTNKASQRIAGSLGLTRSGCVEDGEEVWTKHTDHQ